jgi:hypothetical protein
MANLIISTVCRGRPESEPSGHLYQIDTEARGVVTSCPVPKPPFLAEDPNPRGGLRGARGLATETGRTALSNHCEVFVFDPHWRLEGRITHPWWGSIHDIAFDRDSLLVTSARNDLAFRCSLTGEYLWHWNPREAPDLRAVLPELPRNRLSGDAVTRGQIDFRDPRTHDYETYNRTHLNGICPLPGGDLLVLLGILWSRRFVGLFRIRRILQRLGVWRGVVAVNRLLRALRHPDRRPSHSAMVIQPALSRSVVVRVSPDGTARALLEIPDTATPSHTLLRLDSERCLVLNTTSGKLITFDPDTGRTDRSWRVADGFLRGAAILDHGRLALGSQGDLLLFDLESDQMTDTMRITEDRNEAIYSICLLPEEFAPLPSELKVAPS